jgi:SM-20-related protein
MWAKFSLSSEDMHITTEVNVFYFRGMNDWVNAFEQKGWIELRDFLPLDSSQGLLEEMKLVQSKEDFHRASIGKDGDKHINLSQRGDFISWIDPINAMPYTSKYIVEISHIISILNRQFYLGIRDYECHYAHYPIGAFYKRHSDRHAKGSSRVVSSVFYLNADWQEGDGGELVIYDGESNASLIKPQLGSLILFLSEIEHEVLPTHRERKSITGWMLNETIL